MSTAREIPSAFKHGIYSATTVLPGEDPTRSAGCIAALSPNWLPMELSKRTSS